MLEILYNTGYSDSRTSIVKRLINHHMVTYEINTLPSRKLINEGFTLMRTFLGPPSKIMRPLGKVEEERVSLPCSFTSHQAPQYQMCPYQTWTDMLLEPAPPESVLLLIGFTPQTRQRPSNRTADMINGANFKTRHKPKKAAVGNWMIR